MLAERAVGGATPDGTVAASAALTSITAYVTDQAGNSANDMETLSISVEADGDLETDEGVIAGTYELAVEDDDGATTAENTVTRSDEVITLTATADVALATTVNPFADGVLFYAEVDGINTGAVGGTTADRTELRLIGMVAGNSAEVDSDADSREWTYETEVSADDFYAIVGSSADSYNIRALGINGSGGTRREFRDSIGYLTAVASGRSSVFGLKTSWGKGPAARPGPSL